MQSQNDPGYAVNYEHLSTHSAALFRRRWFAYTIAIMIAIMNCNSPVFAQMRSDTTIFGWSERKLTAVVLSTVIPGSGQSYLGHSTKGAIMTIGTFSCGLMAALSENNVIGRNERLQELASLYALSNDWELSNGLWNQMVQTKQILDRDLKRRDIYLKITAVLWILSVADIVLISEDLGSEVFGSAQNLPKTNITLRTAENGALEATFSYRF